MRRPRVSVAGPALLLLGVVLGVLVTVALYQWENGVRASLAPEQAASATGPALAASPTAAALSPGPRPASALGPGDAAAGQIAYEKFCHACHPGGDKGLGPAVRGPEFTRKYGSDEPLIRVIREGVGTMPPFAPDRLSDKELADIIAYMRSLTPPVAGGPTPSPRPPPATPPAAPAAPSPTPAPAPPTPTLAPRPAPAGQALYQARCAQCHALYNPQDPKVLATFDGMAALSRFTPEEEEAVRRYIEGRE